MGYFQLIRMLCIQKMNKEIWNKIDEILWIYWDPIGVNDDFNARSEYQSYIGGLYKLILTNVNAEELKNYLRKIEKEEIRIKSSDKGMKKIIIKLMEIQK